MRRKLGMLPSRSKSRRSSMRANPSLMRSCSCARKCSATEIAGRNHYWDTKGTPQLDAMMSRYERHMLFYQLLERTCGLDFRIARKEHCDGVGAVGT